jgi:hypothetical protein
LPTILVINIEGRSVEVVWAILGAALLIVLSLFRRGSRGRLRPA